ncbi:MAG: ATP synthase F1 subunit gamma [Candidatus Wallbacteria bacterium]
MKQAKEIRRKIKSITSIQHITRAMKMVSAAKFKKAQNRFSGIKAYYARIKQTINDLESYLKSIGHNYIKGIENAASTRCFVVITGDKGLCGSFNMNVCKEVEAQVLKAHKEGFESILITIGTKGYDYFNKRGYNIHFSTPLQKPDPKFEDVSEVVTAIMDVFESGDAAEVYIINTKFLSSISYATKTEKVLPFKFDEPANEDNSAAMAKDFKFEPTPNSIIEYLLPRFVKMHIFSAIVESSCSEQGSRMITMSSATDKAQEMIGSLTLVLNRARQESITSELLDINGGVEALKKK